MTLYRLYVALLLCAIGAVELLVHWPRAAPVSNFQKVACERAATDELAQGLCADFKAGLPAPD